MPVDAPLICPHCFRHNEVASSPDPDFERPEPGDCSICWECAGVAIVTETGISLRLPTPDEATVVLADPRVRQLIQTIAWSHSPSEAIRRGQDLR